MTTAAVGDTQVRPAKGTIEVAGLTIDLPDRNLNIVHNVEFSVAPGEVLGLIGESGSGKTTVATALLGYAREGAVITGRCNLDGVDLLALDPGALRSKRGNVVSYVPQDPGAALNPARRIGVQLHETLSSHGMTSRRERGRRISEVLADVQLPADNAFLRRYPHELSGGQQQRVVIALAFLCKPKAVVLDEPTTGLDVTTQSHVLETVRKLCQSQQTAGVYVSHDLAVVAGLADRIAVMYFGRMVEIGPAHQVMRRPIHPYTRGLIAAIPDPKKRHTLHAIRGRVPTLSERPHGCVFADRCDLVEDACREQPMELRLVANEHAVGCRRAETHSAVPRFAAEPDVGPGDDATDERSAEPYLRIRDLKASYTGIEILKGLDLNISRASVMALVGESGSGKTTLARCIGGLHDEASGRIAVAGKTIPFGARNRTGDDRRTVQYIFQNAGAALNPRKTVGHAIAQPLRTLGGLRSVDEIRDRVTSLLADVSLGPGIAGRYPAQLSGGERQRVTIARALAAAPQVLICDEITSALDVSIQASILLLIKRLCAENELTLLFVTHNLAVVRAIADRVAVLNGGRIVEEGRVDQVLDHPSAAYTQQLMQATPSLTDE